MKQTFLTNAIAAPMNPACPPRRLSTRLLFTLLLGVAAGLAGCLSRPPLATHTFLFNTPALPSANAARSEHILGIRSLQVATPFAGRPFVYRTGEFSYVRDPYAEFLELPAAELAAPVREWLHASGTFKAVAENTESALKPDTLVEISVSQMYGDFREPGHPQAILEMHFTFFAAANGRPGRVILQREYSRPVPLAEPGATALMAGWNLALGEILADVSADLSQVEPEKR